MTRNIILIFIFIFKLVFLFSQSIETYQYDALHHFEKITKSDRSSITYTFDEVGNRIGIVITSNQLVGLAGNITGLSIVNRGQNNVQYKVDLIANATGYVWSVPVGASIVSGINTNLILIDYSMSAISGCLSVYGTNSYGNGNPSPNFAVTVTTTSGINNNFENQVQVYPNPTNGQFTIDLSSIQSNKCILDLYNLIGQHVFQKTLISDDFVQSKQSLDLSFLSDGIYSLKIQYNDVNLISKIVIKK